MAWAKLTVALDTFSAAKDVSSASIVRGVLVVRKPKVPITENRSTANEHNQYGALRNPGLVFVSLTVLSVAPKRRPNTLAEFATLIV